MPVNTDYNLALLIAIGLCWAGVRIYRWRAAGGRISPSAPGQPQIEAKNQPSAIVALGKGAGGDGSGEGQKPAGRPRTAGGELDRWVQAQPPAASTSALIRVAGHKFRVTPSTVKRALRRAREARRARGQL